MSNVSVPGLHDDVMGSAGGEGSHGPHCTHIAGVALSSWVMWVTFIILSSESGITGWTQRVGLASVVSPEHCSKSTTWSVTSVAAAAENLNVMFLLWLKLSATHILLPQQSNLNVIERKFKRQILKPDPIILAHNAVKWSFNSIWNNVVNFF